MQGRRRHPIGTTAYGTWVGYSGTARLWLALVLLVVAGGLGYAGARLREPLRPRRPGRAVAVLLLLSWLLSLMTFVVALAAYAEQEIERGIAQAPPANPITVVTFTSAALLFTVVLAVGLGAGVRPALGSAVVGAMAAPMVFELPFDLVIMARTYPPIPPAPALYRALFFLPLFLVEVTTLALLTLSPRIAVTRGTLFSLGGMFLVFAAWGLAGFEYPATTLPIVLNVASKILAFVATLTLFVPPHTWAAVRRAARTERGQPVA